MLAMYSGNQPPTPSQEGPQELLIGKQKSPEPSALCGQLDRGIEGARSIISLSF